MYYQNYIYFDKQKPARAVLNGLSVYLVGGSVLAGYDSAGGVCGGLGLPTSEFDPINNIQNFQNGTIEVKNGKVIVTVL